MMFSTDCPYKQIREYLASGKSLSMNVSKESDIAFMRELERTDPKRHANLVKNIQVAALATLRQAA